MAALPVVALPLDYDASLEQIKDFLQNAKPERRGAAAGAVNEVAADADGDDDFEEQEGFEEDAALDLYNLDIDADEGEGEERRRAARPSGYKYRDAMVRRPTPTRLLNSTLTCSHSLPYPFVHPASCTLTATHRQPRPVQAHCRPGGCKECAYSSTPVLLL